MDETSIESGEIPLAHEETDHSPSVVGDLSMEEFLASQTGKPSFFDRNKQQPKSKAGAAEQVPESKPSAVDEQSNEVSPEDDKKQAEEKPRAKVLELSPFLRQIIEEDQQAPGELAKARIPEKPSPSSAFKRNDIAKNVSAAVAPGQASSTDALSPESEMGSVFTRMMTGMDILKAFLASVFAFIRRIFTRFPTDQDKPDERAGDVSYALGHQGKRKASKNEADRTDGDLNAASTPKADLASVGQADLADQQLFPADDFLPKEETPESLLNRALQELYSFVELRLKDDPETLDRYEAYLKGEGTEEERAAFVESTMVSLFEEIQRDQKDIEDALVSRVREVLADQGVDQESAQIFAQSIVDALPGNNVGCLVDPAQAAAVVNVLKENQDLISMYVVKVAMLHAGKEIDQKEFMGEFALQQEQKKRQGNVVQIRPNYRMEGALGADSVSPQERSSELKAPGNMQPRMS